MIVRPLHPVFAAELIGADLAAAPTPELIDTVEQAMARYGILVVRDAKIDDAQQIRLARAFGPLEIPSRPANADPTLKPRIARELFAAGNIGPDGRIVPYAVSAKGLAKGAERFHTDSSFHAMPTKWSALLGVETPPSSAGGDTWFVDARAAYDDLDAETKALIEPLIGVHDFWQGRINAGFKGEVTEEQRKAVPFPPVKHRIVRAMPYGRKALYIGGHSVAIEGMDPDEGKALIERLYAHATQERYIYRHQWRQWDLVIWDNRCTMHAATPLLSDDHRRDMRRTTINESGPEMSAVEALAAA